MLFNIKNLEGTPFILNIMNIGYDNLSELIGEYKHKFTVYHKETLKEFIRGKGYFVVEQTMNIIPIDFSQIPAKENK